MEDTDPTPALQSSWSSPSMPTPAGLLDEAIKTPLPETPTPSRMIAGSAVDNETDVPNAFETETPLAPASSLQPTISLAPTESADVEASAEAAVVAADDILAAQSAPTGEPAAASELDDDPVNYPAPGAISVVDNAQAATRLGKDDPESAGDAIAPVSVVAVASTAHEVVGDSSLAGDEPAPDADPYEDDKQAMSLAIFANQTGAPLEKIAAVVDRLAAPALVKEASSVSAIEQEAAVNVVEQDEAGRVVGTGGSDGSRQGESAPSHDVETKKANEDESYEDAPTMTASALDGSVVQPVVSADVSPDANDKADPADAATQLSPYDDGLSKTAADDGFKDEQLSQPDTEGAATSPDPLAEPTEALSETREPDEMEGIASGPVIEGLAVAQVDSDGQPEPTEETPKAAATEPDRTSDDLATSDAVPTDDLALPEASTAPSTSKIILTRSTLDVEIDAVGSSKVASDGVETLLDGDDPDGQNATLVEESLDEISSQAVEPPSSVDDSPPPPTAEYESGLSTPKPVSPAASAATVFSRPEVEDGLLLDLVGSRSSSEPGHRVESDAAVVVDGTRAEPAGVASVRSAARADTAIANANATEDDAGVDASAAGDAEQDQLQPPTMQTAQSASSSTAPQNESKFAPAPAAPLAAEAVPAPPRAPADAHALSWRLKSITWPDPLVGGDRREVDIICQSLNGPCSLISLCNVLILRGSIHIRRGSDKVSYDDLASLIADFLIERPPGDSTLSIESALEILPSTVSGLNVNPSFAGVGHFEVQGAGGELALFELCGVHLTHGWVLDDNDARQSEVLRRIGTYDAAQMALVAAAEAEAALDKGTATAEQTQVIEDAAVLRGFLQSTQTQLTVPGLFGLNDALQERDLVALFRNSHLSVLYKRPVDPSNPNGPLLYSLVTDESLLREPEVVWESIGDVEGNNGSFFNSEFRRAATAGGDFAGLTAEQAARHELTSGDPSGDYDQQIARDLQEQEDARAARHLVRQEERASSSGRSGRQPSEQAATPSSPSKKKKGCTIM